MKMFVTRLDSGSKGVITGDITQIDLPSSRRSGLLEAMERVENCGGHPLRAFRRNRCRRHQLVQRIVPPMTYKTQQGRDQLSLALEAQAEANGEAAGKTPSAETRVASRQRVKLLARVRGESYWRLATLPPPMVLLKKRIPGCHRRSVRAFCAARRAKREAKGDGQCIDHA